MKGEAVCLCMCLFFDIFEKSLTKGFKLLSLNFAALMEVWIPILSFMVPVSIFTIFVYMLNQWLTKAGVITTGKVVLATQTDKI